MSWYEDLVQCDCSALRLPKCSGLSGGCSFDSSNHRRSGSPFLTH